MDIGMVGLGRMGANMTRRLLRDGHRVVAYDRGAEAVAAVAGEGAEGVASLVALVAALPSPRVVWLMVPAGAPTESTIAEVRPLLAAGDVLVDGGNSNYHDTLRRAELLKQDGIRFVDAGTSGGIWGLQVGYCIMAGGEPEAFALVEPALRTLAPEDGYLHTGPAGSGHYTKMIHNGIEYGMLQAYGEGFEILHSAPWNLDLRPRRRATGAEADSPRTTAAAVADARPPQSRTRSWASSPQRHRTKAALALRVDHPPWQRDGIVRIYV